MGVEVERGGRLGASEVAADRRRALAKRALGWRIGARREPAGGVLRERSGAPEKGSDASFEAGAGDLDVGGDSEVGEGGGSLGAPLLSV